MTEETKVLERFSVETGTQPPMTPDRIRNLARAELQRRDYRILKAVASLVASPEWCDWRDKLCDIVNKPEGHTELPSEPPFGRATDEDPSETRHLESQLAASQAQAAPPPVPLPPNPEEARLSDHGEVPEAPELIPEPEDTDLFDAPASDDETLGEMRAGLQSAEGEDREKLIFSMSDADRAILTEKFRREINETTNEKIRGVRLNAYDEEQYELKLAIYHALAKRGDKRS